VPAAEPSAAGRATAANDKFLTIFQPLRLILATPIVPYATTSILSLRPSQWQRRMNKGDNLQSLGTQQDVVRSL
jgi:hypothetical protein